MGAPIDPVRREELTADAEEGGDVGPLGAGAGTSLHRQSRTRAPAPGGRQAQHSACACRSDLPRRPACLSVRPTRPTRSRAARADPAAPTARLDPFGSRRAPGCRRADACVGRKVRGARADRGACGAGSEHPTERPGWPNASLPPSALLRVRAGPPLLRPLERLLVLLLHLVSGCSHGCSMLLPQG